MPPPPAPGGVGTGGAGSSGALLSLPHGNQSGSQSDVTSVGKKTSTAGGGAAAARTSFNRFSTFVKSGGENYVLGKLSANVQESDVITVVVSICVVCGQNGPRSLA